MIYIGIDDTDNEHSRGTGNLARVIAGTLSRFGAVHGVTRHQLSHDDRIPRTKKNSCATILLESAPENIPAVTDLVRTIMLDSFNPGSDPGLCAAAEVPAEIVNFGLRAKREILTMDEAVSLARANNLLLEGLGGENTGVIGALAAVGLASSGDDGRYVEVGNIRSISGLQPVEQVLASGIHNIRTQNGKNVDEGVVIADKMRPARRSGLPILFVIWNGKAWKPQKLD